MGSSRSARPIATHVIPKIARPIQWPRMSWSDVVGWGVRCLVVSLRGGGSGTLSYRMLPCVMPSKEFPLGVGGWVSGV
eukprot:6835244-Pyramimonas_sp.AAC.1